VNGAPSPNVAQHLPTAVLSMARIETITRGSSVRGILPEGLATVVDVKWLGNVAIEITYKDSSGRLGNELIYRDREPTLEVVTEGRSWSFDGDGALFRLVSEARRIQLAHLFDPLLAVHTSLVDPLPHQITAVYEEMLRRQPLRFLLADDPGAGKTIMTGLLIKELIARGDLSRCLIVSPGSLVEQWQDELDSRFHVPFEIMTNDKLEAARTGNWFHENPLAICRLDKLSRDTDVQAKLGQTDWDLIVCDEAHKLSATYFGSEIKYTKRYRLGQLLAGLTRHFLLLTATPHNGKEADFQLFMALLDGDRFEGKFRDGVHLVDTSDMMRRLVKELLLKFDGTPLFPERIAYTVTYAFSDPEAGLYRQVTDYVREEFNRADALENDGRKGTVGFALTILQRRLASSPEAIYQSLRRRRERLEKRLREEQLLKRGEEARLELEAGTPTLNADDIEDIDEAPDAEVEETEEHILDQATAARTISELRAEIALLVDLEKLARRVRQSGCDRKWDELSKLLQNKSEMFDAQGHRRKLIIFTEHRDTLNYLAERIRALIGRPESVVTIHGNVGREDRRKAQETFSHDRLVEILVATDAAGEGINLQRAHLMVNYDLPWNPNRLEQRFGRIHRIGQQEVCHLWNLVAKDSREGEVYHRLLEKIDEQRKALGGQVFDVLGRLTFEDRPLRDLLLNAIRYGDRPEVRAKLFQVVDQALDRKHLQELVEDRALTHDTMDVTRVRAIREDMERAEARRLQPHFIATFFLEAFKGLGGTIHERESRRYEINHVPAVIRNRDRQIGRGQPVLLRYERITFEKELISQQSKPPAAFVCPGHPLLDSTLDLVIERHRDLLRRDATLVDETDPGDSVRALLFLEHAIQDGRTDRDGNRRIVSKRLQFVEIDAGGKARNAGYAPYLDYRPLTDPETEAMKSQTLPDWVRSNLENQALEYAAIHLVPEHLVEVRRSKEELIAKTLAAVKDRLTKEINYWDHRAAQLKDQELGGRVNAKLNSGLARQRADDLAGRLQKRTAELEQEGKLSALPPVLLGAALIVPLGVLRKAQAVSTDEPPTFASETDRSAQLAIQAVMDAERKLGFDPHDVSPENRGYDIESRIPGTGKLRFIEVKGRVKGAQTVTVTKNEILTGLNMPDDFILAIGLIDGESVGLRYVRRPFSREPDFGATSVNYELNALLAQSEVPA
jgi:superfamily II DNA or RNA helicase